MKFSSLYLIFIGMVSLPYFLVAQEQQEASIGKLIIIDSGGSLSSPLGPFNRNVDHNLYGAEVGVYFQLNQDHPYVIGFDAFYNYMDAYSINFYDNIDGFDIELEEKTSSHLAGILTSIRYYPDFDFGIVKPYAQFSLGAKILFTQTYLTDNEGGDIVSEFDINEIGASLTYGASIGTNLRLSSVLFLNGRVSYLPGNSIAYYSKLPDNEIPAANFALDGFQKRNSTTPIIRYSIGVSIFL